MSKLVGDRLPQEVRTAFDGDNLEQKIGLAYLLCTVDEDESPRFSMLSAGEILAVEDETIRLALWPRTQTGANIRRGSPAVLCFVAPGTVYYARGRGRGLPPVPGVNVDRVEVKVEAVESDVHPGLPVTSAITYACEGVDTSTLIAEWSMKLASLTAPETEGRPERSSEADSPRRNR